MFFYMYENMAEFCLLGGVTSAGLLDPEGTENKPADTRVTNRQGQEQAGTQEQARNRDAQGG